MGGHHLVFGSTTDYLTGQTVADTADERIRQDIARLLVEERGYDRTEIDARITLPVTVENDADAVVIDFAVRIAGTTRMIIRFGPGSLVSRQRAALAAARLLETAHMVPFAVVTNGEDAHLMETATGNVIAIGMGAILSRPELLAKTRDVPLRPIPENRREKEMRILFALDVLSRRECEDYTCRQC